MSLCLHCDEPCAEHAVFCEECQEQARELFQQEQPEQLAFVAEFSPQTPTSFASSPGEEEEVLLGAVTVPFEPSEPVAEALPVEHGLSSSDQVLSRLSAAARLISTEEAGEPRLKRSSRLRPLRDISEDIQRASTPHPSQKRHTDFDTQPGSGSRELVAEPRTASPLMAWPWSEDADDEDKESDAWANSTDPLLARSRPTAGEAALIEEADIRRVQLEEQVTQPFPQFRARRRFSRWHVAFISVVVLAVAALTVDGSLISFAFHHAGRSSSTLAGPPTLALSTNLATPGSVITVQLANFPHASSVALTHDVQETLVTTNNQPMLAINANGSARASFSVDTTWGPGFHLIVAEDVATRDTASATLQVSGEGPSRPPHLLLDAASLDLGDAVQGANTIQPLELRNSGSGSISWSASSDQSWLLVAPAQGLFSAGQSISIAVQRNNLQPGNYTGKITVFSSVGAPEVTKVSMKVSALPPNAGAMIALNPPLLAFTTTDGSAQAQTQVVTLSNPGQQPLSWSLNVGQITATTMQSQVAQGTAGLTNHGAWLSTDQRSGKLAPGASTQIRVTVNGQNLLPGAYMAPLTISSAQALGAYDNPQVLGIALTVQARCGLLTSTGALDFTAVVGQSNPSDHALSLSATSSCDGSTLGWQALSSASWLTISPQRGQLTGASGGVTSIGVNTTGLAASKYTGLVTFQAGKSTQTVAVYLDLQPRPAAVEPIMGVSPLSLNFSTIQGEATPTGQMVTITNNGGSLLKWHTSVVLLGTDWLGVQPTGGTVQAGQTGQATVTVSTASLTPGIYTGQVVIAATDSRGSPASGSPQTITISLTVQPPCALATPSSSSLLFTATAGEANPLAQAVTLNGSGSCAWPLHWSTSVSPSVSWLSLSSSTGTLTSQSQQASISAGVDISGLSAGTYSTQVKISALDSVGTTATGSPQTISVMLTVLQPCTLQSLPSQVTLNSLAGQTTPVSQALTLSSSGSCSGGVTWTATGDSGSDSWLSLSATSGTDSGSGSTITINGNAGSLAPGSYSGQVTVSANNNGMVLQGSPQTVKVTLVVSGYTVSGTALACNGPSPTCTTSQGLSDATVALINSSSNTVETVTADSSGNFTLTNVAPGTYTISASGSSNSTAYSGTVTVTVSADTTDVSVSTFSS